MLSEYMAYRKIMEKKSNISPKRIIFYRGKPILPLLEILPLRFGRQMVSPKVNFLRCWNWSFQKSKVKQREDIFSPDAHWVFM